MNANANANTNSWVTASGHNPLYTDAVLAEHAALCQTAGVLDLSDRSRLCLTGADAVRFLNGQVTNNVKALAKGDGCYAFLVTAKAKVQSDLNIYRLEAELLLDFEPGLTEAVRRRLEQYIIADDVQVVEASGAYGLVSVQGPLSLRVLQLMELAVQPPAKLMGSVCWPNSLWGEIYLMNKPRTGTAGFDWFVPQSAISQFLLELTQATAATGGRRCGAQAWEIARIEAGIPRFGVDIDETNLAPEAGLDENAISYTKGCYIGQEVISRIKSVGRVTKCLSGLKLADHLPVLPQKGDGLYQAGRAVGFLTSAVVSPTFNTPIALGYVQREAAIPGAILTLKGPAGESEARVVKLPFKAAALS